VRIFKIVCRDEVRPMSGGSIGMLTVITSWDAIFKAILLFRVVRSIVWPFKYADPSTGWLA
tara:strand:- start:5783 stop:5965 length:183 start_codon:yes stop_codon:yes gene_type:complete